MFLYNNSIFFSLMIRNILFHFIKVDSYSLFKKKLNKNIKKWAMINPKAKRKIQPK